MNLSNVVIIHIIIRIGSQFPSSCWKSQDMVPTTPLFRLELITASDIPECVSIYFLSFQNPHSLGCWPRIPSVQVWWESMFRDELDEPFSHWRKAIHIPTGETAGFMKWQQPRPGVEPDEDLPAWPEGADHRLCDETFGAWAKGHRRIMGDRGHWCKSCAPELCNLDADVGFFLLLSRSGNRGNSFPVSGKGRWQTNAGLRLRES